MNRKHGNSSGGNQRPPSGAFFGLIGAGCIVIALAYFLHRYPLTISPQADSEVPAEFILSSEGAQVTLWVDTAVIRRHWSEGSLAAADFSYGWANTLEQEFGYYDIQDISGFDSAILAGRQVAVFSVSALETLAKKQAGYGLIRSFVSSGGLAVLDYPDSEALAGVAGIEFSSMSRSKLARGELQALLAEAGIHPADSAVPDSLPLFSTLRTYSFNSPDFSDSPDSSAHSSAKGLELFTTVPIGRGQVLLTGWDFGRWVTLTQQGAPDEQLRVGNRYSEFGHSRYLEANDLVADSVYLNSSYPWVDIIEKQLGNTIASINMTPRWSTAPGASSGIFMMTHDDEGLGDAGVWMNEYEAQHGYVSTSFVMPSGKLSAKGVTGTLSHAGDIGFHWNRFDRPDKAALETLGIGRWRPLRRKRNLKSQIAWLDSLGVHSAYNRNHYFLWDEDPYRIFRILNAYHFTMDYSYGPDLHDKGYLFGSAFPFHPLDDKGASFGLVETPVIWTEDFAGADSAWGAKMLSDNAKHFHGVISALYHNNTFSWAPDYAVYTSWRRAYSLALSSGHRLFTATDLERFLNARTGSAINWEVDSESLEVFCDTRDSNLALVVPYQTLARPNIELHGYRPDDTSKVAQIDTVEILNVRYWRVALPMGRFLLSFDRRADSHRRDR